MLDEYMKKYCEQMDNITLSDSANQAILDDLRKTDSQKGVSYMKHAKRHISAALVAIAIIAASSATVFAAAAIRGAIIKSNKEESRREGLGARVNVGASWYYDLLAGDQGEVYALTDNDYEGELTDCHAIVWRSTDQGSTWESVLFQPDELNENNYLAAGDLWEGKEGIEAVVLMHEPDDKEEAGYISRVYRITGDSYEEYDMDEVHARFGSQVDPFHLKYVNDHVIALVGGEECLLYDTNTQEIVKSLPYDLTMGCLQTPDQFLIYGAEIYSCVDAETLEEQEPEEGLQEFVQTMMEYNYNQVFPPMEAWEDSIVCMNKKGVYEYTDGEIVQIRPLSHTGISGVAFNGLLPMCKAQDGEYYVAVFSSQGMSLWQIEGEGEPEWIMNNEDNEDGQNP